MFTMLAAGWTGGTGRTGRAALLVDPATFVTAIVVLSYVFWVVLWRIAVFWVMPWMQGAAHHDHSLSWVTSPICWPITNHSIKVSAALLHCTSLSLTETMGRMALYVLEPFYASQPKLPFLYTRSIVLILINITINWHTSATLNEDFSCFFLSCKANARV